MTNNNEVCKVCGGSRKEHFTEDGQPVTLHVFTEESGKLMTQEQLKAALRPAPGQVVVLPQKIESTDAQAIQRLVEVLLSKEILSKSEALYIFGVGPKEEASGFIDPAKLFGSGTC